MSIGTSMRVTYLWLLPLIVLGVVSWIVRLLMTRLLAPARRRADPNQSLSPRRALLATPGASQEARSADVN